MKTETESITRVVATEIPGPTRKVPSPKISGSDTNEISSKVNKNHPNSGKDSHLLTAKNTFTNPDYDENYSSSEDEDFDSSLGESVGKSRIFEPFDNLLLFRSTRLKQKSSKRSNSESWGDEATEHSHECPRWLQRQR